VVSFEKDWYKCVIIDNLSNSTIDTLFWIESIIWYKPDFFDLDLRNKEKLEEVFKKYTFDWILHFAWFKAVWESCKKPLEYYDNNIVWSIILFECMKKYNVKNIIFSSSATVYKEKNNQTWYDESNEIWNTSNPYWTTKFIIEQILIDLSKFAWFNVINLRYFNPIWAHTSWYIWENSYWLPNNLLPYVMKVSTWKLKEVNIFWDDYNTKDWTWIRDYIDVVDLIDWHLKAYKKLTFNKWIWFFETYNLWTWKWISVLEIINLVWKITWKNIPYKITSRRYWDLAEVYCNPIKANNELWWKAQTYLEESIKNMYKFYNKVNLKKIDKK